MSDFDAINARIAGVQDAIKVALKNTQRPTDKDILNARVAEQEKEQLTAESVGVSPEDYRKWASGRDMPEVRDAVKKFMENR